MTNLSKIDLTEKWGGATCSRAWAGWDPDDLTKTEAQDLIDVWLSENVWPPAYPEPEDGISVPL